MSEFSDFVKSRADLAEIIGETVPLRKSGANWIGLCPFHAEKTPSFHVHAARQFYYCFGCQARGDVYQFLMQRQNLGFAEALALLAERYQIPLPRNPADDAAGAERQALWEISKLAAEFYRQCLTRPEAAAVRGYLAERQLPETEWEFWGLGYAPESGRALIGFLQARNQTPELAFRAGLVQRRSQAGEDSLQPPAQWTDAYDRFRGRLLFPIANESGKIVGFGGRALQSGSGPKYLNSPETPVYSKQRILYNLERARTAVRELGYAILVEGYFDCVRVWQAGFHNVIASCGTALTPSQAQLLARYARNIAVNFDPDGAGAAAAERSVGLLLEENFRIRVLELGGSLDPDLYIRRQGAEAYRQALAASPAYFDYLVRRARLRFPLATPEGKSAAVRMLLPYLARIHDPILRTATAEQLADQLHLDQQMLRREFMQGARERRGEWKPAGPAAAPALLPAEAVLLRAWAESESLRPQIAAALGEGAPLLEGLASAPIFEKLLATLQDPDWIRQVDAWPAPEQALWAAALFDQDVLADAPAVAGALEALRLRARERSARGAAPGENMAAALAERRRLMRDKYHIKLNS